MKSDSEVQTPKILIAVQDQEVRKRLQDLLGDSDLALEIVEPTGDPLRDPPATGADLLLVRRSEVQEEDLRLVDAYTSERTKPGLVVITETGGDGGRARLMAAGASSVLEVSDTNRELRANIEALAEAEQIGPSRSPELAGEEPRLADFLSRSPRMRRFLDLVQRVTDTDSSLLITGETGVGKERLARAVHNAGPRSAQPFVTVNCGALPEPLLESELFGHEAGAFTGADRAKKGRFEQANGGTIFLDEIGEMPPHLQVNLLTVLQRRQVQRVGSEHVIPVDVRVMAATNRTVTEDLEQGRFREDLYYRLNVVSLNIPALRERHEDIPDLAGRFIYHFREARGRSYVETISDEALDAMVGYAWPGNVRELINAVEHAVVLCRTSTIEIDDLPETINGRLDSEPSRSAVSTTSAPQPARHDQPGWLELPLREARRRMNLEFERDYLRAHLAQTGGKVGATAKLAGISARSLYQKMKSHQLKKEDYR